MKPFYVLIGALIIVAVLVLIFIGIFRPGKEDPSTTSSTTVALADNAASNDVSVSFTTDGVIRGNEMQRAIKITVTNKSRMLEVFMGHDGAIESSESFTNTVASYEAFLAALQTAGFTNESRLNSNQSYIGQCPLGNRIIFTTSGIKNAPELLWTTSCSLKSGTFRGNLSQVRRIFQNQIPNYSSLVSGVRL